MHYDIIVSDSDLVNLLRELRQVSSAGFSRADELLNHNICMISAFTGV